MCSTAEETWLRGYVHLTVDADGLVSLWDHAMPQEASYLLLKLTPEQMRLIRETALKGGATP